MNNCNLQQVLCETEGLLGPQGQENGSVCQRSHISWKTKKSQHENASQFYISGQIAPGFGLSVADSPRFLAPQQHIAAGFGPI